MASFFRTYRIVEGERIDGVFAHAFIHNWHYHLVPICIYQDGMIDCWGLVDLEGFKEKVKTGWVVTQPPEGAIISVSFLAGFKPEKASYYIKVEEFVKEVADEIEALNGRPTTAKRCYEAYKIYHADPTIQNLQLLRDRYEAIPEHNRRYILADMDAKDFPLRALLNATDDEQRREALKQLQQIWDYNKLDQL